MFVLKLDARSCISCGICADSCPTDAIGMHTIRLAGIEGGVAERVLHAPLDSFPYLAAPGLCDGCMDCVNQCPVEALRILYVVGAVSSR